MEPTAEPKATRYDEPSPAASEDFPSARAQVTLSREQSVSVITWNGTRGAVPPSTDSDGDAEPTGAADDEGASPDGWGAGAAVDDAPSMGGKGPMQPAVIIATRATGCRGDLLNFIDSGFADRAG